MGTMDFFESYNINIPPSWQDIHDLKDALLEDPTNETGWKLFQCVFDYVLTNQADYARHILPDPLSFGFFSEEYGVYFDMTAVKLRYFSIFFPSGETEVASSAEDMLLYLQFNPSDNDALNYFKGLFKSLSEEQQKNIESQYSEFIENADDFTSWLLE